MSGGGLLVDFQLGLAGGGAALLVDGFLLQGTGDGLLGGGLEGAGFGVGCFGAERGSLIPCCCVTQINRGILGCDDDED